MSEENVPEVEILAPTDRRRARSASPTAVPDHAVPSVDTHDVPAMGDMAIDTDRLLVYGSRQIIRLFVPVSLCMLFVVIVINTVNYYTYTETYLLYTPFHSENPDVGTIVWENLSNALIFLGVIIIATLLIVCLYKYRCYKFIYGWLVMTSLILLFFVCFIFFKAICHSLGLFADVIVFTIFLWNFGVIGMISLYWKAPLFVQQAYLLIVSAVMSLLFVKYFPEWTTWFLLGLLAVWDLIAVLCPKGPLRILVNMAMEREETLMPALIYSTTAVWSVGMAEPPDRAQEEPEEGGFPAHVANNSRAERLRLHVGEENDEAGGSTSSMRAQTAVLALNGQSSSPSDDVQKTAGSRTARNLREIQDDVLSREDRGVKLGLGDFIFYSFLVGNASKLGDWNITLACYVAILIGMCFTLLLLAIRGHALPALPISIFFGLIFYFCTNLVITPFSSLLADQQVYI